MVVSHPILQPVWIQSVSGYHADFQQIHTTSQSRLAASPSSQLVSYSLVLGQEVTQHAWAITSQDMDNLLLIEHHHL